MDIQDQLDSIKHQVKTIEAKLGQCAQLKDIKTREHYKKIIYSLNAWFLKVSEKDYPKNGILGYATQLPVRELLDAYELIKLIDEKSIQFPDQDFIVALYLTWTNYGRDFQVKLADGVAAWEPENKG